MKLFGNVLFWIVLALLGALAAQFLLQDPGQVRVSWRGTDYTMSLAVAIAGVFAVFAVLVLLWKLATLPFRAWRARSDRLSRARLYEGMDALHAGQYDRAEKLLAKAANEDENVAPSARIAAARAALRRGDEAAARGHLDALGEHHVAARAIAVAELALRDQRPTDALVALDAPAAQPLPPRGLALRAEALAASGQSAEAYGLLGPLRKQAALPAARLEELLARWAEGSLREAPDANALAARWEALPKPLRTEPEVALAYAERAQALGWDEASVRAVEQSLDTRWDERLAARYTAIPATDPDARLATLERWGRTYTASPMLALALAREYRRQGRWTESQAQLQRAAAEGAAADAWEELGNGYAEAGDEPRARISYANALRVARGEAPQELPQATPAPEPVVVEERDAHGLPRLPE